MALRTRSAESVIGEALGSGSEPVRVVVGSGAAEPIALTSALYNVGQSRTRVEVTGGLLLGGYGAFRGASDPFVLTTWFPTAETGAIDVPDKRISFLPLTWGQVNRYLEQQRFDVCLIQVSPARGGGFHSYGISTSFSETMLKSSDVVIGQINGAMPFTPGESMVHESRFDYLVEVDAALPEFPARPLNEFDRIVGKQIAELISDACTLQLGIGATPAAVAEELAAQQRSGLRLWSQLGDPGRSLIESGCCRADYPARVSEIGGSASLYRWASTSNHFLMATSLVTHSLKSLVSASPFVSVNSCLEIDLFGQANSERVSDRQVGLIGGSMDFAMASQLDTRNISILGLPALTSKGASRIVERLAGPATIPRSLVQVVVTEFGVADLRDRTVRDRAIALASIAAPEHRDLLFEAARSLPD